MIFGLGNLRICDSRMRPRICKFPDFKISFPLLRFLFVLPVPGNGSCISGNIYIVHPLQKEKCHENDVEFSGLYVTQLSANLLPVPSGEYSADSPVYSRAGSLCSPSSFLSDPPGLPQDCCPPSLCNKKNNFIRSNPFYTNF